MTLENRASCENESQGKHAKTAKKPYQKPAFRHEKVFETLALACGKVSPTGGMCQSQQKSS